MDGQQPGRYRYRQLDLRSGIAQANSDGGGDTIVFSSLFNTPQTITLTGTQLELSNKSGTETIQGPAAGVTVSGNNASRVFQVDSGVTASISGLTITGGGTPTAAAACTTTAARPR